MSGLTITCEHCGREVHRARGDEGRGRFCSIRCGRADQIMPTRDERFRRQVARGDSCWEWMGTRNRNGYGVIRTGPRHAQRRELTHRVSWEIHNGPIPDGLLVCHHCDNPSCVRPDHLFLGTQADNAHDRDRKGRRQALRGDQHPQRLDPSKVLRGERTGNAKITERDVREIRVRRTTGERLASIARDYGLSFGAISQIARGKSWRHVE